MEKNNHKNFEPYIYVTSDVKKRVTKTRLNIYFTICYSLPTQRIVLYHLNTIKIRSKWDRGVYKHLPLIEIFIE